MESPPEEWYLKYLGGKGMGYRYLLKDLSPAADPLGPENEIAFMTGPFAGTLVPTSSRLAVLTKSPAPGGIIASVVGGGAAAELKYAGYDGVIVRGQSPAPIFLYVTDKRVTFERAASLWGAAALQAEKSIQEKKWTYQARVLAIGPDGEEMVPSAPITADGYGWAGEDGVGAVMGSKKLKAVAIRGQAGVQVADMPSFLPYILDLWNTPGNLVCRSSEAYPVGEVALVRQGRELRAAKDSLGVCNLWSCPPETLAELYSRVTGSSMAASEILLSGERVCCLARLLGAEERHAQLYGSSVARPRDAQLTLGQDALEPKSSSGWDYQGELSSETLRRLGMDADLLGERGVEG